jgi:hypothetical protein
VWYMRKERKRSEWENEREDRGAKRRSDCQTTNEEPVSGMSNAQEAR